METALEIEAAPGRFFMKEYVLSAVITFAAGFALAVVPQIDTLTLDSLQDGTLIGLIFAGIRTGMKGLLQSFLLWYQNRP